MICSTRYRAAHHSGRRRIKPRWIVVHSTEGTTAQSAASWFANPASKGSAHLVVDDARCYRTLPDDIVPWGAPGANLLGLHIELVGFAHWPTSTWLDHPKMLSRAARLVADWCEKYEIPVRWVGPKGLLVLRRGITTHADVTKAFKLRYPRASHWDPGPWFPRDAFLSLVRRHLIGSPL